MSRKARNAPQRPKRRREPMPLLPQHDLPAPYARLVTLGDTDIPAVYEEVAAQIKANTVETGVEKLLEMALDETYYDYYDEKYPDDYDDRAFTRVHAVRTLERLGQAAAPAVEPLLPLLDEEDDWLREEMPFFYAAIGEPAVEPLAKIVTDGASSPFARVGASESLSEIAQAHPEQRDRIVPILEQALVNETEDETAAAFIIDSLLDIDAKESLPIIEQAFQEDRVDLSVVQLADVQEHFGLPITAPRVPIYCDFNEEDDADEYEFEDDAVEQDGDENDEPAQQPYVAPVKVGRNDPCPCGSGKKYKKCCGAAV